MPTEDTQNAHRSLPSEQASPTRQEKALQYLERKQARQQRYESEKESINEVRHTPLPQEISMVDTSPVEHKTDMQEQQSVQQTSLQLATQPTPYVLTATSKRLLQRRRYRKVLFRHYVRRNMRQARAYEQQVVRRFWMTIASVVFACCFTFFAVTGTGAYAAWRFYDDTQTKYIPSVVTLRDLMPLDNLKMYDRKGTMIGQLTDQGMHTTVAYNDVTQDLINATVAIEDKNFWTNPGVDIPRIIQAALDDIRSGRVVEGGSTISQQLIKNLVVGKETTIERKLAEAMLTPELNRRYTKRDIMEMYLNSIYYGEQAYGIDAAATAYFGLEDKPGRPAARQLSLAQSAMLAGLPQYPYGYDPFQHPHAAFTRFQTVLDAMVSQGYITKVQMMDAVREAQRPHFFKRPNLVNRAPHFFNFALSELEQEFHLKRSQLSRSDMKVYTTLDLGLQDKIQKIAQEHIAELRDTHHVTNSAEVLIDYHTGAIISLLGSIDYNDKSIDGQFDVATQGYRQPGSSFKPYVYVAAFEQGASPAQAINDAPLTIKLPGENPPTFSPTNYDNQFHGHMTLRCALQNSLNVPAVKVLQHVGIDNAMNMAHSMGITSYRGYAGYSLVLGGIGVRLIDHTSAYGTFANGGIHVPYYGIEKVVFSRTNQTVKHQRDPGTQVISPQLAYMMTSVLSDNQSRIPEFLDCNVLQLYSNSQTDCWYGNRGTIRPAAAKTGTTNDFRDNWTVGYTTDYVMGVWAGNDDNSIMYNVSGVQGAAPIWHDSMLVAEQGHPIRDFVNPGGLERQTVTYADGVKTTDWFMPGTVPTSVEPTPAPGNRMIPWFEVTPTPESSHGHNSGKSSVRPYCPNDYSFAFSPPSSHGKDNNSPLDPGWW